ncbi:MAG: excinuclease ABC subunit UvrA [Kiritimatiellae bacterium]|nr:excinuclease ABC subunit UvrA [Kiritimatiellia bacterium]
MSGFITIEGAREHNLRNISVKIPRNSLTVVTGLSGSGKSSLAFDTLYAEGQRRYVESLSAYARQFLGQLQKPELDYIDGLSPAIAIEQRTTSNNPRSIVATSTEIHDYLRLLYGSIAVPHCPKCGRPVRSQNAEEVVNAMMRLPERTKLTILAPIVRGRKGAQNDVLDELRQAGFARVRLDGQIFDIESVPPIDKKRNHNLEAVIDRIVVAPTARTRLTDSVELALKRGNGLLFAIISQPGADKDEERIFSEKNACPHCSISFEELKPRNFSFNNPHGACPTCSGIGRQLVFTEELVVPDDSLSLDDGAIQPWAHGGFYVRRYYKHFLRGLARLYGASPTVAYKKLPASFRDILMHGTGGEPIDVELRSRGKVFHVNKPFEGALAALHRLYLETEFDETREKLERYMVLQECPDCHGARLKPESRVATVADRTITDVMSMSVRAADLFFEELPSRLTGQEMKIVGEVVKEIRKRLRFLIDVGLDYVTLDRESSSLSGGEMQRIRLATQIGSGPVGVLYVLDEPTIGLHSRDNEKLLAMLRQLQSRGNTVVVVEHDEEVIRAADHIIDLGPGAGREGGNVVYEGDIAGLLESGTLTADYLNGRRLIASTRRVAPGRDRIEIRGAAEHNLKGIDVSIPLGCFVCVTGVSGSGKSSLVDGILRKHLKKLFYHASEEPGKFRKITGTDLVDKVIEIDQSPIGTTPRSNPATYTDAFTPIRSLFAKTPAAQMRGYGPGRFSFNVKGGRCEACKGDGAIKTEMHFLPDVYVTCDQCGGRRYNQETLQVKYAGKSIADVLDMTIDEACEVFAPVRAISNKLQTLKDVGLGYIQLGQSSTTLSGGEAQRVKLATELSRASTGKTLYLLDEPTTGLHFADVHKLLELLLRLRDAGNTVLVVEHNMDVIGAADYIIDLGPEGGDDGGNLVVAGTPEEVMACRESYTGQFLKRHLSTRGSRQ